MASKLGFLAAALVALSSFASAQLSGSATFTGSRRTMTEIGCFNESAPMKFANTLELYQSEGNCQQVCYGLQKATMGLANGTDCWCGDLFPPKDSQISNSSCNTPCPGYPAHMCGSAHAWTVFNTGYSLNEVDYYNPPESTSVPSSGMPMTSSIETVAKTVEPTSSATKPSSSSGGGGPNTAGIAAGVVAGVVGLAAAVGGVWLYLRYRRRREVEEEYRRQAAVSDFVAGGKAIHTSQSSMNDSRLDPDLVMGRRQSNGSIADDQDFSRRILKVTNPDSL